jgi:sugar phosphate isomerase/epimerase
VNKIVAVDFDGTCVTHEYPAVGQEVPHCVEVLKRLQTSGVKLILWTMRSGEPLDDALDWFRQRGIELWGVNENPEQSEWTFSPKAYAQIYIDDAALGCPLKPSLSGKRHFVDWFEVEKQLEALGVFITANYAQIPIIDSPSKVQDSDEERRRIERIIETNKIPERKLSEVLPLI